MSLQRAIKSQTLYDWCYYAAIILGQIPSILAIIIGNSWLLVFGMFFSVAAGGDFLIVNLISKENKDDLVQDHPSEAGCFIYRKIDDNSI